MVETLLQTRETSSNSNYPESVAFFYCMNGNPERDNSLVVIRSLISQLIRQNPKIVPLVFEKMCHVGGITLVSRKDAEELLNLVLAESSSNSTYIIIDGLDECDIKEMTTIVTTLTTTAESVNATSPGFCRLFFTSRDENAIRRLLSSVETLQIRPKDNQRDIKAYTHTWSIKIQEKFALSESKRQELEESVISRANGMSHSVSS